MCAGESCMSQPESENRVCTPRRLTQLRKNAIGTRRRQCSVPQLALLIHQHDALKDGVGTLPRCVERRGTTTKPIITIPISIYGCGEDGDDAEEGAPEIWCDGPRVWGAQGR